jgi:hypothetical protein
MSMDIVCFANDWDGDPLSKKHIMRRLARRGARVLWVNSLGNRAPRMADAKDRARLVDKGLRAARSALRGPREVDDGIWVVDPIAAPFYGSRVAAAANRALVTTAVRAACAKLRFRGPVHYSFVPASAWVAGALGERLLVYHAADEYAAFGGVDITGITALENDLLARADLYVACSQLLYEHKAPRVRRGRALLLRHGVEHHHFACALDPAVPVPDAVAKLLRPIVGFIGLVAEWVDVELLERLAGALAQDGGGTVAVIGDVRGSRPPSHPLIYMAGRRPYDELARWCRVMSVGTLPFRLNDLTMHANPLKLREYLSAGLPVVSTDIPESRALRALVPDDVDVAVDGDAFVAAALRRARGADDAGARAARSARVAGETWDRKVDVLVAELEAALRQTRRAS